MCCIQYMYLIHVYCIMFVCIYIVRTLLDV